MPKFTPRQRKHKVLARSTSQTTSTNTNAPVLLPESKSSRESRRAQLKAELAASQPQSKVSRAKQKRLDKYIDTKLKKEENAELIRKLAERRVDTSLLVSTKRLGRVGETRREGLGRALREVRRGVRVGENEGALRVRGKDEEEEGSEDEDVEEESEQGADNAHNGVEEQHEKDGDFSAPTEPVTVEKVAPGFGAGLKRPLELDEDGRPVIKRRKREKKKPVRPVEVTEPEWDGFSSEDERAPRDGVEESSNEDTSSAGSGSDAEESGSDEVSDEEEGTSNETDEDDEASGESTDEESDPEMKKARQQERSSAFKAWATQQRNEVLGFTPTTIADVHANGDSAPSKPISFVPRPAEADPLPLELQTQSFASNRKVYSVHVNRTPEIQEARLTLPVVAEEQKIMEAIHNNDAIVVWGATGSGKTTQVPQFLYEAGYGSPDGPTPGMIGVTQPRRVAAVSMSKRVGDELGDTKYKVSYQIRFESSVSDKTAIKFMTDGVLLREIALDFALSKYSAIVIDEAHERSVNTDILIGMMSRIVDLRATMAKENPKVKPLKLVIMSATLRISDFTENKRLFRNGPPPLLQAEGRQYPVTVHFARRTQRDYLEEAFRKVSRGHKKLPPGGMLVFLTGQNEITALSKRLKQAFTATQNGEAKPAHISPNDYPLETEDLELGANDNDNNEDYDGSDDGSEIHGVDDEDDQDFEVFDEEGVKIKPAESTTKVHVLPLYSQLPTNQQLKVFEPPPEGSRLIVLATNVAETSLTIPGIRYVFDCGRAKEKKYDQTTGVQSFEVGWISKASAEQRAGRAGRTGPGHCYRLFSSAVYERDFIQYADPELLRTPIEGIVLQLKSMDLQHVVNFPFPTPPDRYSLAKAEKLLTYLGALSPEGKITPIGRELSLYPLTPRFSKMLQLGLRNGCIEYAIALVAALAVPDVFIPENQLLLDAPTAKEEDIRTEADNIAATAAEQRRKAYNKAHAELSRWDRTSDALKLMTAICAYAYAPEPESFCEQKFLRAKALKEASQLREQLTAILRTQRSAAVTQYNARLPQPSGEKLQLLKQIVAAGYIEQVAIRADLAPTPPEAQRKPKRAIEVPYITLFPSHGRSYGHGAEEQDAERFVYLHPSSVLAYTAPKDLPQFLIYSHLQRASTSTPGKVPKIRMHPLTPVSGGQLSSLAAGTPLLEYAKPIGKIEVLESSGGQERRQVWLIPALVGEKGSTGWPLPAKKVVQRKVVGKGWVIEKILA